MTYRVWDCHVHVFEPDRFPLAPGRRYTPGPATTEQLVALHDELGVARAVLVQPSPYGTDNSCLLHALRKLAGRGRGVVVLSGDEGDEVLAEWNRAGVRGVRLNLATHHDRDPAQAARSLRATAERIAPLGWHVQVYAELAVLAALGTELAAAATPVVIDHFGMARRAETDEFARLVGLLETGNVYVKASAPYRVSDQPDHADVAPVARALLAANPDRVLWGTDWPHTDGRARTADNRYDIEPFRAVDDRRALSRLREWAGDHAQRVLADNPAALYD